MSRDTQQRRLAAIMVADVVGYSRMMEADEAGTLAALKERRRTILGPVVREHGGRIVKIMGDGVLVEFSSAVNAANGSIELQRKMNEANGDVPEARQIVLRIGINLGDVLGEGADIYGDGVNIAARLEALAEPGGICVSAKVHEEVYGKLAAAFDDMGEQLVKNIVRPIRVYRLRATAPSSASIDARHSLSLPDKPSIAVLPFQNMSGDPEQEYFADGMVEEIITALSRMRWLFVIARNSSFAYKGRAVDVRQVARELGVRYILEGSVRKAGSRARITGQLLDAATGVHLWAEHFDGNLEDVFDLQDQVTASVVSAIAPMVERVEIERSKGKPTESLDAYDYYLRGIAIMHRWSREANDEGLRLFYKAIELDPNFAVAYGMAARCYGRRKTAGWVVDRNFEITETARLARRAAELGRNDADALYLAGMPLAFVVGELELGAAYIERALVLNPNLAGAWMFSGWTQVWLGDPEAAIERETRAMRLSPHDPLIFVMQAVTAAAHFLAGRYREALKWAESSAREQPASIHSVSIIAASAALTAIEPAAASAIARVRHLMPELRLSNLKDLYPLRRSEDMERWMEGMRQAGLPE